VARLEELKEQQYQSALAGGMSESLAKIGAGLSAMGMGGGGGVHIHLPHGSVISADTMQKFVGKMNKMVNRGQLDLTASKSMRVNKRSA